MRLLGVNIPDNKPVVVALRYFYGIGWSLSRKIVDEIGLDPHKRTRELKAPEVGKLQNYIERNFEIEGSRRQTVRRNIQLLKELGAYRGLRHSRRLPVRGQRTKTNSRSVRGNVRKTAGSGRRKVDLK